MVGNRVKMRTFAQVLPQFDISQSAILAVTDSAFGWYHESEF